MKDDFAHSGSLSMTSFFSPFNFGSIYLVETYFYDMLSVFQHFLLIICELVMFEVNFEKDLEGDSDDCKRLGSGVMCLMRVDKFAAL